jgi:beta-lactamase superfamily II metal-dependent hydrolase
MAKKDVSFLREEWWQENLADPLVGSTSPENNSSAIILFQIDGKKLLFTGDAGVSALTAACNYADANKIGLSGINFFDVPHHGSRRNLGPTLLNRLFGGIRHVDTTDWHAYVSVSKDGAPKHPNKKVMNALRRRGAEVAVTAGQKLWLYYQAPARTDYGPLQRLEFYTVVESDES